MAYVVSVDFGAGAVDVSAYLIVKPGENPVHRSRALHNELKPVTSTAKFWLNRSATVANYFLAATTDPIVTITKDGAAYFKGTVRRSVKVTVGPLRIDALECQCVDALYRLDRAVASASSVWASYTISNPGAKASSILHQLFYAAGFADGELSLSDIATTVDRYVIDGTKALTYRALIEEILRDTVYTMIVSSAGIVSLVDLAPVAPASSANLFTGAGGNVVGGYKVERVEAKSEAVDVTYWTHQTIAAAVVFEDSTGKTATLDASIPLGAGGYYPDGADATHSVRAVYKLEDYELLAVDSAAIDWAGTGVAKQVETPDGLGMLMRYYAASGGTITRNRVTGTALVKKDKCKIVKENVASTKFRETLETRLIYTQAGAERIAGGRAAWYLNSAYQYVVPLLASALPAIGAIVTIVDAQILGVNQLVRVLKVDETADPLVVSLVCEGVGAYTYAALAQTTQTRPQAVSASLPSSVISMTSLSTPVGTYTGQLGYYLGQVYQWSGATWILFDATKADNPAAMFLFDDVPDMPDSAAGTTYLSDWSAGVDGWTVVGATLTVSEGVLVATATATTVYCLRTGISSATNRTIRIKYKSPLASTVYVKGTVAGVANVLIGTFSYSPADAWQIFDCFVAEALTTIYTQQVNLTVGDVIRLQFAYVGTGEYAANSLLDTSGNGNHGTIYGATPVAGISGKALSFDSVNDYVLLDKTKFSTTGAFTVCGWVQGKASRAASQILVSRTAAIGNRGFYCSISSSNKLTLVVSADGTAQVSLDAPAGTEMTGDAFFAFVFDPGVGMYIYKNGVLIASDVATAPASVYYSASQVLVLGALFTFGNTLNGWLDEVQLYDRALSASEIRGLALRILPPARYSRSAYLVDKSANDGVITPGEKPAVMAEWRQWYNAADATACTSAIADPTGTPATLEGEYGTLRTEAHNAGILYTDADRAALLTAINAVRAYYFTTPGALLGYATQTVAPWQTPVAVVAATMASLRATYREKADKLRAKISKVRTYGAGWNYSASTLNWDSENGVTKTGANNGNDCGMYRTKGIGAGAFLQIKVPALASAVRISLNQAPSLPPSIYPATGYGLYVTTIDALASVFAGTPALLGLSLVAGDVLRVSYDGQYVRCFQNGAQVAISAAVPGLTFYPEAMFYHTGKSWTGITFGQESAPVAAEYAPKYLGIGQLAAVGTAAFAGYTVSAPTIVGGEITVASTTTSIGSITPNTGDWMVNYAGAVATGVYKWTGTAWTMTGITADQRASGMEDMHRLAVMAVPVVLAECATFDEIVAYQVTTKYLKVLESIRIGGRYDKDGAVIDGTVPGFFATAGGCKAAGLTFEGSQGGGVQWGAPSQVGNELNIAGTSGPVLAALSGTDVAFIDYDNEDLRVYRFNGTDWSQVGNDLNIAGIGNLAIAALNGTDVAFIDDTNDDLRVYRFDGTNWAQVGNDLYIPAVANPALAALNGTDVAFIDSYNDDLRVYRFDGTDWAQVGNDLYIAGIYIPDLASINETDVAFIDSGNADLHVYRFDGTDWAQVGNELYIAGSGIPALAALNGSDVAFIDSYNDELRVYRFDGTDWGATPDGVKGISAASVPALAALNGTDVAFIDGTNEDLRVYRFPFCLSRPYSRQLTDA